MTTFNPRRFVNVEIMRQVHQDRLIEFLQQYAPYLKSRGAKLVKNAEGEIDFDGLVRILLNPVEGVDVGFIEKLCLLHDVSQLRHFDDLRDLVSGVGLPLPNDATPADIALQIIMHKPDRLQRLQAEKQIARPKTYIHYVSDEEPPENFSPPTEEEMRRIVSAMDNFYAQNRGGRGCSIFVSERLAEGKLQFLIKHGMQFKRECSVVDGKPSSVVYRPESNDIFIYDFRRNRLSIYNQSQTKKECDTYVRVFGATFFQEPSYFYRVELFALAPLRDKGRAALVCSDVDGMEEVRLVELRINYKNPLKDVLIRKSTDIFASLDAANEQFLQNGVIEETKFEFKMSCSKDMPTATVMPFGKTTYTRASDGNKIDEFFEKRSYMLYACAA